MVGARPWVKCKGCDHHGRIERHGGHRAKEWHSKASVRKVAERRPRRNPQRSELREAPAVVKREQAKLDSLRHALLQATRGGSELPESMQFAQMGATEATEIVLGEVYPKGLSTAEIAKRLKARGLFSKSTRFGATVYATLRNAAVGATGPSALVTPKFRRKDGLWYLARARAT